MFCRPVWWRRYKARDCMYILSVVVLSFALAHIFKSKLPREKVQEFYTKKFPVIFYASIIVFAVIHIFNFYNISNIWYILPLLVLPQLLFGALLAYIRMKYGISWSIVGHCLHNGMASLPLVFIALMPAGYMEMAEAGRINREIMTSEASLVSFVFSLIFIGVATLIFISVIKLLREYYRGKKKIG